MALEQLQYIGEKTAPEIISSLRVKIMEFNTKIDSWLKRANESKKLFERTEGLKKAFQKDAFTRRRNQNIIIMRIQEGYLLTESIRQFLTGETITANYGFIQSGTLKYIKFDSIKSFFQGVSFYLDRVSGTKIPEIRTSSPMREAHSRKFKVGLKRKITSLTTNNTKDGIQITKDLLEKHYKFFKDALKANRGQIYEAYLLLQSRGQEIPIGQDAYQEKSELWQAIEETQSNLASFAQGGDIDNTQIKFGRGASISIDPIINSLQIIQNMFNNFLQNKDLDQLSNAVLQNLTKINFDKTISEEAKESALIKIKEQIINNSKDIKVNISI